MFKEILKYEILVKGLYESLLDMECKDCLSSIIKDENERTEFTNLIKENIKYEGRHIEICRNNIGSFRRIMAR